MFISKHHNVKRVEKVTNTTRLLDLRIKDMTRFEGLSDENHDLLLTYATELKETLMYDKELHQVLTRKDIEHDIEHDEIDEYEQQSVLISTQKLLDCLVFDPIREGILWNGQTKRLSLQRIAYDLTEVSVQTNHFKGNAMTQSELESTSLDWHIGRVKYFIQNPDEINPIEVETCGTSKDDKTAVFDIPDGCHRLMAILYLGLPEIVVYLTANLKDALDLTKTNFMKG